MMSQKWWGFNSKTNRVSRLFVLCICLVFGGKCMKFRIIFSLQNSININTFEVDRDPLSDSLHNTLVKPKNMLYTLALLGTLNLKWVFDSKINDIVCIWWWNDDWCNLRLISKHGEWYACRSFGQLVLVMTFTLLISQSTINAGYNI
jgi:hypothetical protein